MSNRVVASVEGEFISWARESAGYSRGEIAEKLKKTEDEVLSWEKGTRPIYLSQLRKFASICERPISDFYLTTPPRESPIPHDFRRVDTRENPEFSPSMRFALRNAREKQSSFLYLIELLGSNLQEFEISAQVDQSAETIGENIRSALNITYDIQAGFTSPYQAFNYYRRQIQSLNVLVFLFGKVSEDEANGFSMYERFCPLICVNRSMSVNRRIFALFHELVHILLRTDGICDLEETGHQASYDSKIEAFCNRVAACTLMPKKDFSDFPVVKNHSPGELWNDSEISAISNGFKVSRESVVRRLLTFGMVSNEFYATKRNQYTSQYKIRKEKQRERNRSSKKEFRGESAVDRALGNYGFKFSRAVLDCLSDDKITLADASDLLDVRFDQIGKVEDKLAQT